MEGSTGLHCRGSGADSRLSWIWGQMQRWIQRSTLDSMVGQNPGTDLEQGNPERTDLEQIQGWTQEQIQRGRILGQPALLLVGLRAAVLTSVSGVTVPGGLSVLGLPPSPGGLRPLGTRVYPQTSFLPVSLVVPLEVCGYRVLWVPLHRCVSVYLHTGVSLCTFTLVCPCVALHRYVSVYLHTGVSVYLHTGVSLCTFTPVCLCVPSHRCVCVPSHRCACVPSHRCACVPSHRCVSVYLHTGVPVYLHTGVSLCTFTPVVCCRFACSVCGEKFNGEYVFGKHMKEKHGEA